MKKIANENRGLLPIVATRKSIEIALVDFNDIINGVFYA